MKCRSLLVGAQCLRFITFSQNCRFSSLGMRREDNELSTHRLVHPTTKPSCLYIRTILRCHYTKSNLIDDHSHISSKKLQKQNFKPLCHYTCMQCGISHLQTVQENILSHIILATYRKFTVAPVRFTQNVSCNIYTHSIYQ